jgi:hypothetical protein
MKTCIVVLAAAMLAASAFGALAQYVKEILAPAG